MAGATPHCARPDEGGALPWQRLAFVIGDRRLYRQHDRGHFGRGPQPQIDAQHIAVAVARLEQLDHPPPDPHRRFLRHLARAARQRFGVEDQDRVDIGRIVEFAAALLAQRNGGQPARFGTGGALGNGRCDRPVERGIGEVAEQARDPSEII